MATFSDHLTITCGSQFPRHDHKLPIYLRQCSTVRRQQTIAAVLYVPRQRRGPDGPGVQRPHAICAARSPNFHIDDAAKSSSMTQELGGCRTNRVHAPCGLRGATYVTRPGRPILHSCLAHCIYPDTTVDHCRACVCRYVIRCTSSCAITTHSYHIPGRVRRWLPGKPSHASEQGPMGPHGRVGSPLSGLPSYGTTMTNRQTPTLCRGSVNSGEDVN